MKNEIQIKTREGQYGWITEVEIDDTVELSIIMNSNCEFVTDLKVNWPRQVKGGDFEDTLEMARKSVEDMMVEMIEDCERLKELNAMGVLYREFRPMKKKAGGSS